MVWSCGANLRRGAASELSSMMKRPDDPAQKETAADSLNQQPKLRGGLVLKPVCLAFRS
jgi:hypothetical protein